jgi:hypothetical protein
MSMLNHVDEGTVVTLPRHYADTESWYGHVGRSTILTTRVVEIAATVAESWPGRQSAATHVVTQAGDVAHAAWHTWTPAANLICTC